MALFSPQAHQAWSHGRVMKNAISSLLSGILPVSSVGCGRWLRDSKGCAWHQLTCHGELPAGSAPHRAPAASHPPTGAGALPSTHLPRLPLHQPLPGLHSPPGWQELTVRIFPPRGRVGTPRPQRLLMLWVTLWGEQTVPSSHLPWAEVGLSQLQAQVRRITPQGWLHSCINRG